MTAPDYVDLHALVDVVRGITFPTTAKRRAPGHGLIACLRTTNVQDTAEWHDLLFVDEEYVRSGAQLVQPGDILVSMSNSLDLVGKCAIVTTLPMRATFGAFIAVVRAKDGIDPRYVFHVMRSPRYRAHIRSIASTTTNISNINSSKLLSTSVPLFGDRTREAIVSKIDELFSHMEDGERALERTQKLVERYRQSVLRAAVTGELTRDWREKNKGQLESGEALLARILKARREAWEKAELDKMKTKGIKPANDRWKERYREPPSADATALPDLPDGWVWATVEQLSTKVVDGVHKKPNYVASGVPFVTVKNLTAGPGISFEKLNYITEKDHTEFSKRTNPQFGDVLVSKDGTLGVTRVVQTDAVFSIFVSVALVKPVLRGMGEYVGLAVSSPVVQAQMVPKGSGLQHIHLEDLRQDCIPLPSLEEQQKIGDLVATQLASVDHIEGELVVYAKQTKSLTQSVLSAAFSGSLAPQDSADQPATALLQRLSDGRQANAVPGRGVRRNGNPRTTA